MRDLPPPSPYHHRRALGLVDTDLVTLFVPLQSDCLEERGVEPWGRRASGSARSRRCSALNPRRRRRRYTILIPGNPLQIFRFHFGFLLRFVLGSGQIWGFPQGIANNSVA